MAETIGALILTAAGAEADIAGIAGLGSGHHDRRHQPRNRGWYHGDPRRPRSACNMR
jgi:hypothetical protein